MLELVIDRLEDYREIAPDLFFVDFQPERRFTKGYQEMGYFLNEHQHSVYTLMRHRHDADRADRRLLAVSPISHYAALAPFVHGGFFFAGAVPGLHSVGRNGQPNMGFDRSFQKIPRDLLRECVKEANVQGNVVAKKTSAFSTVPPIQTIRLLQHHVQKALDYGLLPLNTIFSAGRVGHTYIGKSLEAEGHNVIYEVDDVNAVWKELGQAFLTWQILNGLFRGCRYIGIGGAANLFSIAPIECLYLYEFSDKFNTESMRAKSIWQQFVFGTVPLISTPSREDCKRRGREARKPPYHGPCMGYLPCGCLPIILQLAANKPVLPLVTGESLELYYE